MKKFSIKMLRVFVLISLIVIYNNANSNGTNNSNKTFTPIYEMSKQDWNNPEEKERAWQAALVRIPVSEGEHISTTMDDLRPQDIKQNLKYPTVIYLHGCAGVWESTHLRMEFLANNGFAVIAPVSFARKKYPKSCDLETKQAGLYRDTLRMRQYDAGYAIEKAKTLSWVDSNNVFLMGLSQGGITTATFRSNSKNASVNARVIEGWTCHAGWREYNGIRAPKSEPVLTLVGTNDPWFQNQWTRGDCTSFINKRNGSKSIVYTDDYLSYRHLLLEDKEVQAIVLQFLQVHIN